MGLVRGRGAWLRHTLSALVAACALAGCSSGPSTAPPSTAHPASYPVLVDAGEHLLSDSNFNAAEQLFQQAIAREPSSPVAYYDLGVTYGRAGSPRLALHAYREALAADPKYVPALYNRALLVAVSNPPLAEFELRQILALQPDSPTALFHLGLLDVANSALRPAGLRELRRALTLQPTLRAELPPSVRRLLGLTH